MKSYREVAQQVLERRDAYLREKRRRRRIAAKAWAMAAMFCILLPAAGRAIRQAGPTDASGTDVSQSPWADGSPTDSDTPEFHPSGPGMDGDTQSQAAPPADNGDGAPAASGHGSMDSSGNISSGGSLPVAYSSLQLPQGQVDETVVAQYTPDSMYAGDILPFSESMLSDCCAILEGKITDMYVKQYAYDIYIDESGSQETFRYHSSAVVYELTVDRVWYGDQSLAGASILIEDDVYLVDSYFSLKTGRCYVLPIRDAGDTKQVFREYAGGDLTRDSRYATLYPYHPQIEATEDGSYIVPGDWETLCAGEARAIQMDTFDNTLIEYHPENKASSEGLITTEWRTLLLSRYDALFYYDKMNLLRQDEFFLQLNRLIGQIPE